MSSNPPDCGELEDVAAWIRDARRRTFELVDDLTDEQLQVPPLDVVNPLAWEVGHIGWFQEKFALRYLSGEASIDPQADSLYDSTKIGHEQRWALELPSRSASRDYLNRVSERILERMLRSEISRQELDLILIAVFHEDMHAEALTYTRQSLGYPAPVPSAETANSARSADAGALDGDVRIPGGTFQLGASPRGGFCLDNEQWAHPVTIEPFAIARAPVTQAQYACFIDDGGYHNSSLWQGAGWAWRNATGADHPVHFRREASGWCRRRFDRWVPLEPHRPMVHVNWYEVNAYCRWANRRLPSEAEWEAAASGEPSADGNSLAPTRRPYPWGDTPARPGFSEMANLDGAGDTCDVAACAAGDSAFGCRQMLGNIWEWTSSLFLPYPGFSAGAYKEYSAPWFGTRRVLRGGSWATRSRLIRNTWRNYFTAERRDVFAGFRTCAVDS